MQGGDLSNEVEPRLLVVFEGLLGIHTDARDRAKYVSLMKFHRYDRAIRTFTLNERMQRVIWDTVFRRKYAVDVVTFLHEELADPLKDALDDQSLPVGRVWYSQKQVLARSLNYRPDVVGVFHPGNDAMIFGSKGYTVNPANPVLIGAF